MNHENESRFRLIGKKLANKCQTEEIPRPYRCKESLKLQSSKGRQGKAMIRTVVCLSKKCKIHGEDAKSGSHSHHCLSLGDADAVTVAQIGSDWQSGRWLQLICSSTRTFAFGSSPGWLHGTALAKSAPGRGGRCRRCRRCRRARGLSHGIRSIGAMRLHVRAIALQKEGLGTWTNCDTN